MICVNRIFLVLVCAALIAMPGAQAAIIDDAADLATQQAQEKQELEEMRREIGNVKSNMGDAISGMDQLRQQVRKQQQGPATEVHLIAEEGSWEVIPGVAGVMPTYNARQPGPVIRVKAGDAVRVVLHNKLKVPTSLYFHGLNLPHAVNGLPRKNAGLVNPGQTYTYDFVAQTPGTYWYHPQVVHGDQPGKGLCGVIVVEPAQGARSYDRDFVLMLGRTHLLSNSYFTVNGKSAPAIAPIEVRNGERVRLRLVNAAPVACPIYLSGHKLEIVGVNGESALESHVTRDTLTLQPGDRYDVEFTADNPGVWSLSSLLPEQSSNAGKFPGGIAVIVRYPGALPLR